MNLFEKHSELLNKASKAIVDRGFFTPYPEHFKAYPEEGHELGKNAFDQRLNSKFDSLHQANESSVQWAGFENSPYTRQDLGITYPVLKTDELISNAQHAMGEWRNTSIQKRFGILAESIQRIEKIYFEMAYATMHTTGQSYIMAFQASGPHAADRALESLVMSYNELNKYTGEKDWIKSMGKIELNVHKKFKAVPKGITLGVGCSTFPVWNSVPGIYASLMAGSPVIHKPHASSTLPIVLWINEIQKVLQESGIDPNIIQFAFDDPNHPVAKSIAENEQIKIIDYTGGPEFGTYLESLSGKTVFTEKSGVNCVIIDSVEDADAVSQNISFSASLFGGQMCTAPQNIFIPKDGVLTADGKISYEEFRDNLLKNLTGLAEHPKMGPPTLSSIGSEKTFERVQKAMSGDKVILKSKKVDNPEFEGVRNCSVTVLELDAQDVDLYQQEWFGPIVCLIKTKDTNESISIAKNLAHEFGAISCAAYSTDDEIKKLVCEEMEQSFVQVSLNFTGPIWVNQSAAFSDFHVSGGNPAGNASFSDTSFVSRRFVWIGHRELMKS